MNLVFVYNAEAGLAHGFVDSVHKLVSPATYKCDLCAITYGLVRMKPEWRLWLEGLARLPQFFHRSDFRKAWPDVDAPLPAVFSESEGRLASLLSPAELARIDTIGALIAAIEERCGGKER